MRREHLRGSTHYTDVKQMRTALWKIIWQKKEGRWNLFFVAALFWIQRMPISISYWTKRSNLHSRDEWLWWQRDKNTQILANRDRSFWLHDSSFHQPKNELNKRQSSNRLVYLSKDYRCLNLDDDWPKDLSWVKVEAIMQSRISAHGKRYESKVSTRR